MSGACAEYSIGLCILGRHQGVLRVPGRAAVRSWARRWWPRRTRPPRMWWPLATAPTRCSGRGSAAGWPSPRSGCIAAVHPAPPQDLGAQVFAAAHLRWQNARVPAWLIPIPSAQLRQPARLLTLVEPSGLCCQGKSGLVSLKLTGCPEPETGCGFAGVLWRKADECEFPVGAQVAARAVPGRSAAEDLAAAVGAAGGGRACDQAPEEP